MNAADHDVWTANPYQQVVHGLRPDGLNAVPPEAIPDILNALAAQLRRTPVAAAGELHVRIGRLRIIVADPAALEAAGLRGCLGSRL